MEKSILRRTVWEEMLYANMRANYFAELTRNYTKWDKCLRVAGLAASSGSVVAAFPHLDLALRLIAPIVAVTISFWLLQSQYGSLARDAADLNAGWGGLSRDYERLWNHLDVDDAEAAFNQIFDIICFSDKGKRNPIYWLSQDEVQVN